MKTAAQYLVEKIRPGRGFAHAFHLGFIAFIPLILWVLIRLDFVGIAFAVMFLSKWRMLAIHPRYWISHVRSNAVDIIFGISMIVFIAESKTMIFQALWVIFYEIWLLYIKPGSSTALVSLQAILAQSLGLTSLFLLINAASLWVYVVAGWGICYFSARHFLTVFEDRHGSLISSIWAFFAGSFMWILGHWLLFFGMISQVSILLTVLGFGLAGLYYLDQYDRLSLVIRRQILFMMLALVFVIIVFSDWGDKAV